MIFKISIYILSGGLFRDVAMYWGMPFRGLKARLRSQQVISYPCDSTVGHPLTLLYLGLKCKIGHWTSWFERLFQSNRMELRTTNHHTPGIFTSCFSDSPCRRGKYLFSTLLHSRSPVSCCTARHTPITEFPFRHCDEWKHSRPITLSFTS